MDTVGGVTQDARAKTNAALARLRAAQDETVKTLSGGLYAALGRLGRGIVGLPNDIRIYITAADVRGEIDDAPPGDATTKARLVYKQVLAERRMNTGTFLGVTAGWVTGGWTAFGHAAAILALLTVATLTGLAGYVAYRTKGSWGATVRLGIVLSATIAAEWVHLAADWSIPKMVVAYVTPLVAFIMWAAGDGSVLDDIGVEVKRSDEVQTDTRYNRLVEGFTVKLGIKEAAKQITVIGAGLEPVDKLWSKMRLQFPGTTTNDQIQDAVPGVASFMGISAERLDAVGVDDGHGGEIQGVVDVWLASGDQWGQAPTWPLLSAERVSVWEPMPFIVTNRGVVVSADLLFAMWMLISKPRHGKTFAMRLLALAFALDPTADYAVFDFKVGGRDWLWARKTAVASGYGNSDETVKAFLDYLESVLARAEELGALFQALPEHLVPHGQLTKEACEHEPRLRPLGIFVDEVHFALQHPKYGKPITTAMSRIARELPFLAVTEYIASQRADVRTSIPAPVRELAANRVAGKLYTSRASGDVLGDAANDMGYNAKNLRPVKGLFIVHGADDTSSFDGYIRGRAYLVDNVQATQLGEQALARRTAAGVALPGIPVEVPEPPAELLAAIEVLRSEEVTSMRSEELASRLGTTPQRLLRAIGVRSRQEPADGWCKHVYLADLDAAATGAAGLRVVS